MIWARIKAAWLAFVHYTEKAATDDLAEVRGKIARIRFAAIITGVHMAILDEINALDGIISNALAKAVGDGTALATAQATVTDLTNQVQAANAAKDAVQAELDQANTAIQALAAKFSTPA